MMENFYAFCHSASFSFFNNSPNHSLAGPVLKKDSSTSESSSELQKVLKMLQLASNNSTIYPVSLQYCMDLTLWAENCLLSEVEENQ